MITPGTFPLIISHRITFPDLPNFTRFPYEHRNSTSEYASTSHHSKTIQSFFFSFLEMFGVYFGPNWPKMARSVYYDSRRRVKSNTLQITLTTDE